MAHVISVWDQWGSGHIVGPVVHDVSLAGFDTGADSWSFFAVRGAGAGTPNFFGSGLSPGYTTDAVWSAYRTFTQDVMWDGHIWTTGIVFTKGGAGSHVQFNFDATADEAFVVTVQAATETLPANWTGTVGYVGTIGSVPGTLAQASANNLHIYPYMMLAPWPGSSTVLLSGTGTLESLLSWSVSGYDFDNLTIELGQYTELVKASGATSQFSLKVNGSPGIYAIGVLQAYFIDGPYSAGSSTTAVPRKVTVKALPYEVHSAMLGSPIIDGALGHARTGRDG